MDSFDDTQNQLAEPIKAELAASTGGIWRP
jgi:hypothetical protein